MSDEARTGDADAEREPPWVTETEAHQGTPHLEREGFHVRALGENQWLRTTSVTKSSRGLRPLDPRMM